MEFSWSMLGSFTGVLVTIATGMSVVQGWKDDAFLADIKLQNEHYLQRVVDTARYTIQTEMGNYENIFTLVEVDRVITSGLNSGFGEFKAYFNSRFDELEVYVDAAGKVHEKKIFSYLYIDRITGKRYTLRAFPLDSTVFIDTIPILNNTNLNPQ